jgi:hypothetical protein
MPELIDLLAIRLQIYKLFYQCNAYEEEILKKNVAGGVEMAGRNGLGASALRARRR